MGHFLYISPFQSTLPVWGGTGQGRPIGATLDISIHPPRVGRDVSALPPVRATLISIHPPRVGTDFDI